ncbi:DNA pilot protein [Dipodfec virus RodF1_63]|uniref:DNA pilot protein n=1 Tax=Dipodfec virus RodF1_63 TaxID=2929305 RepID=A0A976R7H1_9VIRU|nr:DNA pilot protein [Dipodfec virus RodF1_63]
MKMDTFPAGILFGSRSREKGVSTAKIKRREKETGKKAYTAVDYAGNLHYAFDQDTLNSIVAKANNEWQDRNTAREWQYANDRADKNNAWSAQQAQNQMDFEERLSNTSHQREVADLKAAGLNPVLSANAGASTPSGAMGTVDTSTSTSRQAYQLQKIAMQKDVRLQEMALGAQLEMNKQNIASAQKMAKWSNALQKELGYANMANALKQSNITAGAAMYGANQSAAAAMYGADQAFAASKYGVDNPNTLIGQFAKFLSGDSNTAKKTTDGTNVPSWLLKQFKKLF